MLADTALALVPNGTPDARLLIEERELAHNMGSQRLRIHLRPAQCAHRPTSAGTQRAARVTH